MSGTRSRAFPQRLDRQLAFERFVEAFIGERLDAHGTWKSPLASWTAARLDGRADVIQIRFEEMRAQPAAVVRRISSWLGAAVSEADITRAVERSSIDRMRGATAPNVRPSPDVGPLVDQGRVGGWRDVLTQQQVPKFDEFADGLKLMGYPTS
ncbi:MAG: sulfotransferase domain-containing protein [Candidatus Limnocylindrales bacterium]